MSSNFISPYMMTKIQPILFTASADVQAPTSTKDTDSHEEKFTYTTRTGMSAVDCRVSSSIDESLQKSANYEYVTGDVSIFLVGNYPQVSPNDLVTVAGSDYLVMAVKVDSEGILTKAIGRVTKR